MSDKTFEEYEEDLQGVQYVFERLELLYYAYSEALVEYANQSPTFKEEYELFGEPSGEEVFATSRKLEAMEDLDRRIGSEFECVLKFGYMRGLFRAFTMLDSSTGLGFEEIEPKFDRETGR